MQETYTLRAAPTNAQVPPIMPQIPKPKASVPTKSKKKKRPPACSMNPQQPASELFTTW